MPGFMSGGYTYQPDTVEKFDADAFSWGSVHVSKVHRVKTVPAAPVFQSVAA